MRNQGVFLSNLYSGVTVEPLSPLQRPCLWPQRPKRRDGELFSSWLWPTAVAAGLPPRQFVRDEVGENDDDIDRDIAPATLQRLAGLSGAIETSAFRSSVRLSRITDRCPPLWPAPAGGGHGLPDQAVRRTRSHFAPADAYSVWPLWPGRQRNTAHG
jgi:hypothetical protein